MTDLLQNEWRWGGSEGGGWEKIPRAEDSAAPRFTENRPRLRPVGDFRRTGAPQADGEKTSQFSQQKNPGAQNAIFSSELKIQPKMTKFKLY